jgi:hypothetical protein
MCIQQHLDVSESWSTLPRGGGHTLSQPAARAAFSRLKRAVPMTASGSTRHSLVSLMFASVFRVRSSAVRRCSSPSGIRSA